MGLVVDTCTLIDAERKRQGTKEILLMLSPIGTAKLIISAVTLMELAHGMARAKTNTVRRERIDFIEEIRMIFPVVPVSKEIALRAGELDGTLRAGGFTIGLADAIIAATALQRGDAVVTRNARHFQTIANLEVVEL